MRPTPTATGAEIDAALLALADPARRGTIELLRERPRAAGELADALDLPRPAMSKHLKVLRDSGLVDERRDARDARIRIYRLQPERFETLDQWLGYIRSFWAGQLSAFKDHAESAHRGRQ